MNGTHLQSVPLVVTCSGALVLRAGDVEVVAQRQTYALGIGVHVLVCQTDGIVGGHLRPGRAEDVVGIERTRQAFIEE